MPRENTLDKSFTLYCLIWKIGLFIIITMPPTLPILAKKIESLVFCIIEGVRNYMRLKFKIYSFDQIS